MKSINIKNQLGECEIIISRDLDFVDITLSEPEAKIITDKNLYLKYHSLLDPLKPIVIDPGEQSKSIYVYFRLQKQLLEMGLDRHSKLIAFGGGVISDLVGFVASTFLRGIHYTFVPTSLLGMIDASIGGKNGINLESYKNIIGTFNLPDKIIINPDILTTLPKDELRNGFSEAIKAGLITDISLIEFLEENVELLKNLDPKKIDKLIYECVKIKTNIVDQDALEGGLRKILNFGHTIGHAIESIEQIPHGQAVAKGMMVEAILSEKIGLSRDNIERIKKLIEAFELATDFNLNEELVMNHIYKDKKKKKKNIDLVLLKDIGNANVKSIEFFELSLFFKSLQSI